MSKLYKYELTLVTGEAKEFESKYSPDELRISLSGSSYSLKAYGDILYGNVIHYKLLETIEETTTIKESSDDLESNGVFILKMTANLMIVIPALYFMIYKVVTGSSPDSFDKKILCVIFILGVIIFFIISIYQNGTTAPKDINKE